MNVSKSIVLLASLAAASGASAEKGSLISLSDGIEPLTTRFNDHQDRARIVAILSPT